MVVPFILRPIILEVFSFKISLYFLLGVSVRIRTPDRRIRRIFYKKIVIQNDLKIMSSYSTSYPIARYPLNRRRYILASIGIFRSA